MRLDKWLWCSRFFKTRSIAAEAIKAGKIKINGERAKPAKSIAPNDQLSIRKDLFRYEITVIDIPKARLSAALASQLYEEHADSIETRQQLNEQLKQEAKLYPRAKGRPTKHDRRQIIRFKSKSE